MASSFEELGLQFETVKAILKKEGDPVVRPAVTQCIAVVKSEDGEGRCPNDICFVENGDYWSKLCKNHHTEDEEARANGTQRVARV